MVRKFVDELDICDRNLATNDYAILKQYFQTILRQRLFVYKTSMFLSKIPNMPFMGLDNDLISDYTLTTVIISWENLLSLPFSLYLFNVQIAKLR